MAAFEGLKMELEISDKSVCVYLCVCVCARLSVCGWVFWTSLCRYSKVKETNKKCMKTKWMTIKNIQLPY